MAAFAALGLDEWLARLPDGLATLVGERGDQLSVGERQLVALARAQIGAPGVLILDEATSAVDPDTEQVIARALGRLGQGRTTVTIAHRLSTAEAADLVAGVRRRADRRGRLAHASSSPPAASTPPSTPAGSATPAPDPGF